MKVIKEIRANGSVRVHSDYSVDPIPSRTDQSFKKHCDVNHIMERYRKTGTIQHIRNQQQGVYADLTAMPVDYHEALTVVSKANNAFSELPAKIRNMFQNDPAKLIEYLDSPMNDEEAIKLGLKKRVPKQPGVQSEQSTVQPNSTDSASSSQVPSN